jgi:hypothetical protein
MPMSSAVASSDDSAGVVPNGTAPGRSAPGSTAPPARRPASRTASERRPSVALPWAPRVRLATLRCTPRAPAECVRAHQSLRIAPTRESPGSPRIVLGLRVFTVENSTKRGAAFAPSAGRQAYRAHCSQAAKSRIHAMGHTVGSPPIAGSLKRSWIAWS